MFLELQVETDESVDLTADIVLPLVKFLEEKQIPAGKIVVHQKTVQVLPLKRYVRPEDLPIVNT